MSRYAILLWALCCAMSVAPAQEGITEYPLWDGEESIASYARRTGLSPTRDIDLGKGVRLEMVLIPAGRFTMGVPQPKEPDTQPFYYQQLVGAFFFSAGLACLLVLVGSAILVARRAGHRVQVSLARFTVMAMVGSVTLLGALHWLTHTIRVANLESEYRAASRRWYSADLSEQSSQEVLIPRPFYLGKYEVTQKQFETVLGYNPSGFNGAARPVDNISYSDAQCFCVMAYANSKGHIGLRLPSDAEWEYACRAGTRTSYHTGEEVASLDQAGWYEKNSNKTTYEVGQKAPNRFALHDMHGNVSEWCGDVYDFDGNSVLLSLNSKPCYWVRGGSWLDEDARCRAAFRHALQEETQGRDLGFRVALDVAVTADDRLISENRGDAVPRLVVARPRRIGTSGRFARSSGHETETCSTSVAAGLPDAP